jgi:hypothetical protein
MDETTPAQNAPTTELVRAKQGKPPAPPPENPTPAPAAAQPVEQLTDERDGKRTPGEWASITGRVIGRGKTTFALSVNNAPVPQSQLSGEHRAAAVLAGWSDDALLDREEYETAIFEAKHHGNIENARKGLEKAKT